MSKVDYKRVIALVKSVEVVKDNYHYEYSFPDIEVKIDNILWSLSEGRSFEEMVSGDEGWMPFTGLTREHVAAACRFAIDMNVKNQSQIHMTTSVLEYLKGMNKILIDFIKAFDPEAAKEFSKSPLERLDDEKTVH